MATAAVVLFGLLVVATVGAFFVTQRLKRSSPVVKRVSLPLYVSPNNDGRKDSIKIKFFLPRPDRVKVSMVDGGGDEVRGLADRRLQRGRHVFRWDGRANTGYVPRDGTYYLRVALAEEARATTAPRGVQLVTKRPKPKLVSVEPARVLPGARRPVTIRYSGPTNPTPLFSVYRTNGEGKPQLVSRFLGALGSATAVWDGRDEEGRMVPPGTYAFAVTVQNRARVSGSWPRRLPPRARKAAPDTGVTVTGPQAAGPLEPVRAGSAARLSMPGQRGAVAWRLVRVGETRAARSGRGRAPALRVPVPRDARSGLYVIRLRTRAGAAAVPLTVTGAESGSRVLVVLPAISWQGQNPVDDDADGFPNTLERESSILLARPFAFGRLPAALPRETAPLLAFLDERRRRYDITTDLALARGRGPEPASYGGVLFAGSALWVTEELGAELRAFVESGGRLASFGADAFRRTVKLTDTSLTEPSEPEEANVFGEAVAPLSSEAAPLVVHADELGLFGGSDGYVGLFTSFEQQEALADGARVLTDAGRNAGSPAFVAYRLGRGTVIRTGTPEWARAVGEDTEVAAATEAVWDLLAR
jgi:flagellar hook assembly protein FlgD